MLPLHFPNTNITDVTQVPHQRSLPTIRDTHFDHIKKLTAYIAAEFIRTTYILARDFSNNHPSTNIPNIPALYKCGTRPSINDPLDSQAQHRLRLLTNVIPRLFTKQQDATLNDYLPTIMPFIHQRPTDFTNQRSTNGESVFTRRFRALEMSGTFLDNPLQRLSATPLSLEKTLIDILTFLPDDIVTFLSSDVMSVQNELLRYDQPLPIFTINSHSEIVLDPFYEKMIGISCVALLFIKYAPHFFNPSSGRTFSPFTVLSSLTDKQKIALNMISTVSRSLLYENVPSYSLIPTRQSWSYIDSSLLLAMLSLSCEKRAPIIDKIPQSIHHICLNPLTPSSNID